MSTQVLPSLLGLGFSITRTPKWKTGIVENVSGKEVRIAYQSYPRYQWDLTYNFLRSAASFTEFQQLIGFFNARYGKYDSFLFADPDDYTVTAQAIGTGDGSTTTFQLVKSFGSFVEPVLAPNVVSNVYLNGVNQASGWTVSSWGSATPGILTFSSPPGSGVAITATFTYYYPVRFVDDNMNFENFMYQLYMAKKVSIISIK